MKIESNNVSTNFDAVKRLKTEKPAQNTQEGARFATESASTDITKVSELQRQALQSPEIRMDKIEALRNQIASGDYKIDSDAVAEGILRDLDI